MTKLLVYGTIIPYAGDGVHSGEAQRWQRHREAAAAVVADCGRLRGEHPHSVLVLAGDFNMNLDGTQWYGLNEVKAELRRGLDRIGMLCWTLQDIRKGFGFGRANIDHIWASANAAPAGSPRYWLEDSSDHNGASVRLSIAD